MFRDTAASKETMEFWSEVETPSQNSTKSCHSKVHVLPEYIFWEKNIAFRYYCSFKRYTLENCLAVGVWGLYFKNLLFKLDMFDYSEGRGREVSHSPRNKHMYKNLTYRYYIFQFWIRFYEKLKEKFPKEDGLNSKQTKFLLKTLLEVCDDGMCLSKITQEN